MSGAEEAAALRAAAEGLAEIGDITKTSQPREIFFDIASALEALDEPVRALLVDNFGGDADYTDEIHATLNALRTAASGVRDASNNI